MSTAVSAQIVSVREGFLRRPLVAVAGFFIVGVALSPRIPEGSFFLLIAAMVLLLSAVACRRWARLCDGFLAAGLVLSGAGAGQLAAQHFAPDHIAHFTSEGPVLAQVEGVVVQEPRVLEPAGSAASFIGARQVAQLEVKAVLTTKSWTPASGRVALYIQQPLESLQIRQTVRVLGMLQRPAPAMNPGQFDWRKYYRDQRVLASLTARRAGNVSVLATPGPTVLDRIRSGSRRLLAKGFAEKSIDHALLRALVLGDSDPQLRDVQDQFVRTGTSHHLAISGMHVGVLGGILYGLCRCLFLSPRKSVVIATMFVVLYGAVALPSPPVVRSVLLCLALAVSLYSGRTADPVQMLALSVLAMLVYQPLDLFNAGFQLSFWTVLALMLFTRRLTAWGKAWFRDPDAEVAESFVKPGWAVRARRKVLHQSIDLAATGAIASLAAYPLVMFHFNQINPWGIFSTVVLMIPVMFSLVGGLLKVVLTGLFPFAAPLWASLSAAPVHLMRILVKWLDHLPGGNLPAISPPVWFILLFYGLFLLLLWPHKRNRVRQGVRLSAATGVIALFLLPWLLGSAPTALHAGSFRMTLLSVGAGQCAVLHTPSGKIVLIDVGSSSLDVDRQCLGPYLKHLGKDKVDAIFVSHANFDHYSGAAQAMRQYGVKNLFISSYFPADATDSSSARQFLRAGQSLGVKQMLLSRGDKVSVDGQTQVEVLWPPAAEHLTANDSSLVLRVTCFGRSILFTGDVQAGPRRALRFQREIHSDVLVAPHHGSTEAGTDEFIASVAPEAIVSSNDSTRTQKQREFDRMVPGRQFYRTDLTGAIMIDVAPGGAMAVQTFRRGREEVERR